MQPLFTYYVIAEYPQKGVSYTMAAKKMTAADFFDKNNAAFMKFGRLFTKKLTNEELISSLAEKDLEKLAKVFKLVFEMLSENSPDNGTRLAEMISAYSELKEDE